MTTITSAKDVAVLGTILGIWAHPDDESFTMAGLMAMAVQNGQTVACVTATKGEAGSQDEEKWPLATIGEVRSSELAAALKILGVEFHHWLDYADGGCRDVRDDEAVSRLVSFIERYQPDTIVTFPPDGITGHPDHVTVSQWSRAASESHPGKRSRLYYAVDTKERYECFTCQMDEKFNIYFNIDEPATVPQAECDLIIKLEPDIARLKCEALAAMPSQMGRLYETFGKSFMQECLCVESFVRADNERQWGRPKPG